jgi:hypothetical protein
MNKVSLSIGLLPPSLGLKIDFPLDGIVPKKFKLGIPSDEVVAALGRVLDVLFEDQFAEGDAAGAWSRQYPAYVKTIYGSNIPSDIAVRESITCSSWVAFSLRHFVIFASHEQLDRVVANRLASFNAYLEQHFNDEIGAYGLSSRPTSIGHIEVVGDLRHTSWAVEWMATGGPNDLAAQNRLRKAADWVHQQIDRLRRSDDRAVTHAALHRLLSSHPAGSIVIPSERARLAARKRLESRIVEGYDDVVGSWDMSIDPPAAAIRNALFVLYCMPVDACIDDDCRHVISDALRKAGRWASGVGLTSNVPNAGATCTLAYVLERNRKAADISGSVVVEATKSAIRLVNAFRPGEIVHPWHLASLLLLADKL